MPSGATCAAEDDDLTEESFIDTLRKAASHPGARGLRDDAAVLELGDETLVITHDMMAEGVHWFPGTDEHDIARKLVATNLSDLAAKGARPIGAVLGFTLGDDLYNSRFAHWFINALMEWNVPLLGGDTISADVKSAGLTLIGSATHCPVPGRDGASPGDGIWVCGHIGDAMIGYNCLKGAMGAIFEKDREQVALEPYFTERFLRPEPLLDAGYALAPVVTAMMDVSDGLLIDATRMAQTSGASFDIALADVPFSAQFDAALDGKPAEEARLTRDAAMAFGDDYALLFTLPRGATPPVEARRVGTVMPQGANPLLIDGSPPPDEQVLGYRHGSRH